MKKSIKLSALFLLLSASVFAGTVKETKVKSTVAQQVSFAGSTDVSLNINTAKPAMVRFYDADQHLLASEAVKTAKAFNIADLDNGNYLVKISSGDQELTKTVVVYNDGDQKSFFVVQ